MKDGVEIEIWYRWCSLDKIHEYSVVCRERDKQASYSGNLWILWIWYRLGEDLMKNFRKNEKQKFKLLPFANEWDEKCKLLKEYKDLNNSKWIIPTIVRHFNKVKKS